MLQGQGKQAHSNKLQDPWTCLEGIPEHREEAQSDTRRIHQEDPPGGLGTTLEQTFDQGLGARVRLVTVLLRWPSTYVSRQIS